MCVMWKYPPTDHIQVQVQDTHRVQHTKKTTEELSCSDTRMLETLITMPFVEQQMIQS